MTDGAFLADPSGRLTAVYQAVHERRMRGLPFVNAALRVEAVAFAPWKAYWLGVMVTPWSMNLMLLPGDARAWRTLPVGGKRRYRFPAGEFDFVAGEASGIGEYLACSLFSPVLEFADHATARQTAVFAREAIFDPAHADEPAAAAREQRLSRREVLQARFLDHEPRR